MPALDLGIHFSPGDLPISAAATACRNPSSFLKKLAARSPTWRPSLHPDPEDLAAI